MARQYCWWPGIDRDIENTVRDCDGCANAQKNPAKVAVRPWEVSDAPWKRVHVDLAGPIDGEMFMIVVDAHSKWPEVIFMPSITTDQTIEALKMVFCRFGYPEVGQRNTVHVSKVCTVLCRIRYSACNFSTVSPAVQRASRALRGHVQA